MEAILYETHEDGRVHCRLCSHRCTIRSGGRGVCRVRENRDGRLQSLVYGRLIARNVDPIEKKPIYHMAPGSLSYSIATVGCNFKCLFCQNSDISQLPADHEDRILGTFISPDVVVADAENTGCRSISFTYTEPTISLEYVLETVRLAHERNILTIWVSNGYMSAEALSLLSPFLDAANIDLKGFTEEFYHQYCGARLAPVKETLIGLKKANILVEVTTLLIPGLNDDPAILADMADFIAGDLGVDTPWHISRFHPAYRMMERSATPVATITRARKIGLSKGLRHVYSGNVPGMNGESTYCYQCGRIVIERYGFSIIKNVMNENHCPYCRAIIDGVDLAG